MPVDELLDGEFAIRLEQGAEFKMTKLQFNHEGGSNVSLELVLSTTSNTFAAAQFNNSGHSVLINQDVGNCGVFTVDKNYAVPISPAITVPINFLVGYKSGDNVFLKVQTPVNGKKGDHGPNPGLAFHEQKIKELEDEFAKLKGMYADIALQMEKMKYVFAKSDTDLSSAIIA